MLRQIERKGIANITAVLISILITAIVVGAAVYVVTPKEEVAEPGEVTEAQVESFLKTATSSVLEKIVRNTVTQDILSEVSEAPRNIKLGWITPYEIAGEVWNLQLDEGLARTKERFPFFDYIAVEAVDVGDATTVAVDLIKTEGVDIVWSNFEFEGLELFKINEEYPDTIFVIDMLGDWTTAKNVIRAAYRAEQAAYLAGLLSGFMTETNHLGILGAEDCPWCSRSINTYALGAWEANPDVKVHVRWVGSWYDPPTEAEVVRTLIDEFDADIIFGLTDSPAPAEICNTEGVWYIPCWGDMVREGWATEEAILVNVYCNWDVVLDGIIKSVLAKVPFGPNPSFMGMSDTIVVEGIELPMVDLRTVDKVGIDAISSVAKEKLTQEQLNLIQERREQMIYRGWDPYIKELVDTEGIIRSPEGEIPSMEFILIEHYYLKGIDVPGY